MLIFFEGHDKSGKTTIAKALVEYLNSIGQKAVYIKDTDSYFAIKHNSEVPFCSHIGLYGSLYFPYLDPNLYIIVDRYVLSEIVYSKVFNRVTDDAANKEILNRVKAVHGLHIVCYKTNTLQEDELFAKQDQIRDEYLKLKDSNILHLDTTDEDIHNELNQVLMKMNELDFAKEL